MDLRTSAVALAAITTFGVISVVAIVTFGYTNISSTERDRNDLLQQHNERNAQTSEETRNAIRKLAEDLPAQFQ